jgi:hypothetical protein
MLRFRYHANTAAPVEIEGVTPQAVAGKSLAQIERG